MASHADDDQVTRLALAAGNGDAEALEQFIKVTQRDVWRCVAHLGDVNTADDLTQETFLRAVGALPRFTGRSSARTWLLSIARRVVVDQIRRNQARPRTTGTVALDGLPGAHRRGGLFEAIIEVKMLLAELEPDRRDALIMTQVLGLTYAEAADVCGCPVGTIRSRVARAREDLIAAAEHDDLTG